MENSPTQILAKFAAETTFEKLSGEVVHAVKRLILDTIGCAIGGYSTTMGKIVIELKRELGGSPESTVVVLGEKTSCTSAAFVNAELANALDADETLLNKSHSANSVVLPALAVAEREHASGKDMIAAVALGFDVSARIGHSLRLFQVQEDGELKFVTNRGHSWAIFGSAIAAGKILGLDSHDMAYAMGIAGHTAPPAMLGKWGLHPSPRPMTKYAVFGTIAEGGVLAALLAGKGFTADSAVLDGDFGFWRIMGAADCVWENLTSNLGEKWMVTEVSYKPYPSCRFTNIPLDLFYRILRENELRPDEIEKVDVKMYSARPGGFKGFGAAEIKTEVDGQWSIPYLFAVAALGERPGPGWHSPDKWRDPKVLDFSKRVTVGGVDPAAVEIVKKQLITIGHFKRLPASVEVSARGQKFSAYAESAKGDPWTDETRMTDDELKEKFRYFSYRLLRPANIEKVIDQIYDLEKVDDVGEICKFLVG